MVAVAAGLMLAAAFPWWNVAGLAWLGPGLILAAAAGHTSGGVFRIGYAAGLAYFLASLYWILLIPMTGAPLGARLAPVAGWLALAAYVALYPAIWAWLSWRIFPARMIGAGDTISDVSDRFLETRWTQRTTWALCSAGLWVAGEMIRSRLFTGFPWNLLGVSQYQILPLVQVSTITGIYGVSFLVAWFSIALLSAGIMLVRRPVPRSLWLRELMLPVLAVAIVAGGGAWRFRPQKFPQTLRIALVQPSIPQAMIWNEADSAVRFEQLLALSRQALAHRPQLLVWPEAAVPGLFRFDTNINQPILALAATNRVWMIIGADDAVRREGPGDESPAYDVYNSSFLISPDGEIVATYRKRRLVIFGEYVPLQRWLPFIKYLTPIGSGFSAGDKPATFELSDLGVKTSVLICFEDAFPHLARECVDEETDFLLNLTNNGWFGESAAQWQHAAAAVFRAIENGVPLVRCANNGLTCWVDDRGRMHDVYFPGSTDVYQAGYKIVDVPMLNGTRRPPTFYNRYGDLFGWSVGGLAVLVTLWRLVRRDRETSRRDAP